MESRAKAGAAKAATGIAAAPLTRAALATARRRKKKANDPIRNINGKDGAKNPAITSILAKHSKAARTPFSERLLSREISLTVTAAAFHLNQLRHSDGRQTDMKVVNSEKGSRCTRKSTHPEGSGWGRRPWPTR
jgi:hypothetical protein